MKVRFAETALAEVDEILSYIAARNLTAAQALRDRIERATEHLASFPYSAPLTDEAGVRQKAVRHSAYVIFYMIEDGEVFVLHVWHGARRRPWEQPD